MFHPPLTFPDKQRTSSAHMLCFSHCNHFGRKPWGEKPAGLPPRYCIAASMGMIPEEICGVHCAGSLLVWIAMMKVTL
jgi:hypothetical protein